MSISVIIASIPPRKNYLARALSSVLMQTKEPKSILTHIDFDRWGAAKSRDFLIKNCNTEYIAILDDDDQFLPNHLEDLYNCAVSTNADLVYPGWKPEINGLVTHLDWIIGKDWDNNSIHQVPITWLAKTKSILEVGGFCEGFDQNSQILDSDGHRIGEDFLMIKKLVKNNKKIVHLNKKTWIWNCRSSGTQGKPSNW